MKKLIALLLVVVMCLSFAACGAEGEKEVEREMISVSALVSDLENLARAEQNVGKATHLFGSIDAIGTESFTLKHMFYTRTFTIPMDSAVLAELNKGDYIAVYAVVEEINGGDFKFKNCKQIDMELMDEYVVGKVSTISTDTLLKTWNGSIVSYVTSSGDTFKMSNDDEIAAYIIGKWLRPYPMGFSGTFIASLEYFDDGECIWKTWDSYFNEWDNAYCSWSVKDGIFDGCSADDTAVYKITNDAMVTADDLYIRAN
jgi:hypothetical protein